MKVRTKPCRKPLTGGSGQAVRFAPADGALAAQRGRAGSASIDYVLVLAVIIPLATFLFFVVPRMIQLVYEMTITMIGSPLM